MAVFEIKDKTEKVAVVGDDLLLLSDSEASHSVKSCKISSILPVKSYLEVGILPGETPSDFIDGSYALCNGQLISDAASTLFNGKRVPNLIGADVVLTLSFSPDGAGATATVPEADRMAIGIHDDVNGSGIASNTVVKSMNYDTGELILSDVSASGSIEVTFTNEGRSPKGGSVAGTVGNQMQRLRGTFLTRANSVGNWLIFPESPGPFSDGDDGNDAITLQISSTQHPVKRIDFDTLNTSNNARVTASNNGKTTGDCFKVALYMKIK